MIYTEFTSGFSLNDLLHLLHRHVSYITHEKTVFNTTYSQLC